MLIAAVRTYEPWTLVTVLGGVILLGCLLGVLILALGRDNR